VVVADRLVGVVVLVGSMVMMVARLLFVSVIEKMMSNGLTGAGG
jgi:hypothetical protein